AEVLRHLPDRVALASSEPEPLELLEPAVIGIPKFIRELLDVVLPVVLPCVRFDSLVLVDGAFEIDDLSDPRLVHGAWRGWEVVDLAGNRLDDGAHPPTLVEALPAEHSRDARLERFSLAVGGLFAVDDAAAGRIGRHDALDDR